MNRISLSDRDVFVPKEGEVFFAEVPGKGDLESMCKAYLCVSERTLDCLVFKKVK